MTRAFHTIGPYNYTNDTPNTIKLDTIVSNIGNCWGKIKKTDIFFELMIVDVSKYIGVKYIIFSFNGYNIPVNLSNENISKIFGCTYLKINTSIHKSFEFRGENTEFKLYGKKMNGGIVNIFIEPQCSVSLNIKCYK